MEYAPVLFEDIPEVSEIAKQDSIPGVIDKSGPEYVLVSTDDSDNYYKLSVRSSKSEELSHGEIMICNVENSEGLFIKNENNKILSYKDEQYLISYINRLITRPPEETSNKYLEVVYPVGSIYISTSHLNSFELFGEWVQIKDKFLLVSGNTYKSGEEGGEASHTLTIDE